MTTPWDVVAEVGFFFVQSRMTVQQTKISHRRVTQTTEHLLVG